MYNLMALVLAISGMLILAVSIGYNVYIKREKEITFKEYLKVICLDKESLVEFFKPAVPVVKSVGRWVFDFIKSQSKPASPVLMPNEMLWTYFGGIIEKEAYDIMNYEVGYDVVGFPKFVYADFNAKNLVTDEVREELIGRFEKAFRDWAQSYGWGVDLHPVCDVAGTQVNIRIYYNDVPEGAAAFAAWKNSDIIHKIGGVYKVLEEKEIAPLLKSDEVFIGVDAEKRKFGATYPLYWSKDVPHCVLCGPTGSGKSVLAMFMVRQLLERNADVVICDFKGGDDWRGILPSERFATFYECDRVFDEFYQSFQEARANNAPRERYLIFDEVGTWLMDKDRADSKDYLKKLKQLALQGRSFGFHIILIMQQPNADLIGSDARDSLGFRVHMGQISPETKRMVFPSEKEIDVAAPLEKYCGYIHISGDRLRKLQTARVADVEKLKADLIELGKAYYTG